MWIAAYFTILSAFGERILNQLFGFSGDLFGIFEFYRLLYDISLENTLPH